MDKPDEPSKRYICAGFREGDFHEFSLCAFGPCYRNTGTPPFHCARGAEEPAWRVADPWEKPKKAR
jgi:hypothetical protein